MRGCVCVVEVDFFAKPFDNHDLLSRIEDLIWRIDSR
jgi:hypothetical protein